MQQISDLEFLKILTPQILGKTSLPRKSLPLPVPNNAFIKPVRQSFVTNPRMMPNTKNMVLMLLGWAGQEQAIETTIGIIAKKIGRSTRQVHRYLIDAIEEGYLFYSRTKDRMGYYTGIKVYLNFGALKPAQKRFKNRRRSDMTSMTETNSKSIYKRENTAPEQQFLDKIEEIKRRNNLPPD